MKKQLLNKLSLLLLFFPVQLFAQDITGLWKGELYVDSTKKYLPYEIAISEIKGRLVGYSHITFEENGKMETGIRDITIKRKDNEVTIEDVSLIDNSFSFVPPKNIKKTMVLTLSTDDTMMVLKGDWSTNRTKRFLPATGSATLRRKSDFKSSVLYKRLTELKLDDQLVFNKPVKKPAAEIIAIELPKIENPATPEVLINPDEAKKTDPVKVARPIPPPAIVIAAVNKPVVIKTPAPAVATPAPTTVAVVAKPAEVKKPIPAPVIAKPQPPPVAVISKPVEVTKPVPVKVIAKPLPPPVTVVSKPVEVTKPVQAPVTAKPLPPPVTVVSKPVEVTKPAPPPVIVEKKPAPIIPTVATGAADVNKRTIATTQSVFYQTDSLVLTLYDNGYVDGDTVSVVMNGEVIFSKQGLSTKAVSKTIRITKETPDTIKLVMYAENLGSIPPNTGLLVVHDGEAVYDVRFSADLKSNAAINLTRKKKE